MKKTAFLIANFGGPRNLNEVFPFLQALLTDQDVIRTPLPSFLHRLFFTRLAKKRAKVVSEDYAAMGGKSPIYDDTEAIAHSLGQRVDSPILTFHRYLPATHQKFIQTIQKMEVDEIRVFPMFPQFTYATTGSIARWLHCHLPSFIVNRLRWIKSYPAHPAFISTMQQHIRNFLNHHQLKEDTVIFIFSAHGIPKKFVAAGDLYQDECQASFHAVMQAFPNASGVLSYQSKFGRGEWLKPYTIDVCQDIDSWCNGRSNVVFIPISFTSDHLETLIEIERDFMPVINDKKLHAYRVSALTRKPEWIDAIATILEGSTPCNNQMLIRHL